MAIVEDEVCVSGLAKTAFPRVLCLMTGQPEALTSAALDARREAQMSSSD